MKRFLLLFMTTFMSCALFAQGNGFENKSFTVNGVSFEMIAVQGGTFMMGKTKEQKDGAKDEKPAHSVTLSDYYIGKFEVTQELWMAVMGEAPDDKGGWEEKFGRGDDYPAYRISWNNVQDFIAKLNQMTGAQFRLPTEAEWEYAARGGNKSHGYVYSGSNNVNEVAWSTEMAHPVGKKAPNELGLYDMSGNVDEWCQDFYYEKYYTKNPQTNPTGPESGRDRVTRGGAANGIGTWYCRVSYRGFWGTNRNAYFIGFRLAMEP